MGLFDKKYCDICGERIRFLGNRKLEDGNLCKDCEAKLSPWFSDRRRSTVQDIKDQLAYREENKQKVAAFTATRSLGEGNVLLIDDEKKQFIVRRSGQTMAGNPDVLLLSQVYQCEIDVEHSQVEEKQKNEENKMVPFDPPRHTHTYRFYLDVKVNHPWFDDMRFRINKDSIDIQTGIPVETEGPKLNIGGLVGVSLSKPTYKMEPEPENDEVYQRYEALAEEMKSALLQEDKASPADEAGQSMQCPFCSAQVTPDQQGRCPYCGEKIIGG